MAFTMAEKLAKNNVMIVDALNLAFRWKHSKAHKFVDDYLATVASIATSYSCNKIIITADKGESTYRLGLLPEYKGNRRDKYATQTEQDKEDFMRFLEEYYRVLEALEERYVVLRYQGVEADDIAAYIVKNKDKLNTEQVWLISSDRDWDLLVQPGVNRWSYNTRKETRVDNWDTHYDIEIDDYISYKCLTGDAGDNIPGFPGVGPKRAAQLIYQYGSAFDIYDRTPLPGKYKYVEAINNNKELIPLNYELMDLLSYCEDAIGADNLADINKRLFGED